MKLNTNTKIEEFKRFMFAGNAQFSMYNNISGNRVNFKIKQDRGNPVSWRVIIPLTLSPYTWTNPWRIDMEEMNCLKPVSYGALTDKYSKEEIALSWLLNLLFSNGKWRDDVEIIRLKICGYCGRPLKSEIATRRGLGSSCAKIPTFISVKDKQRHAKL